MILLYIIKHLGKIQRFRLLGRNSIHVKIIVNACMNNLHCKLHSLFDLGCQQFDISAPDLTPLIHLSLHQDRGILMIRQTSLELFRQNDIIHVNRTW